MSHNHTLYSSLLSANGRKVEALALHLGIELTIKHVNIYAGEGQAPEYLAINGLGQIPSYTEADFCLTESNAIIAYLAQQTALTGNTAKQQALINSWLFWESSQWQPLLSDVMAAHVGHILLPTILPEPTEAVNWQHEKLQKQLNHLESTLAKHRFLAGTELSLADFAVAAMTTYFAKTAFPFDAYPHFSEWYKNINALSAWQKTLDPLWKI